MNFFLRWENGVLQITPSLIITITLNLETTQIEKDKKKDGKKQLKN
jgi:hypothetical protein